MVAVFILVERWLYYHRNHISADELLVGLTNVLKRDGRMLEATSLCENTPGPIAKILKIAILDYDKDIEDIRQAISEKAMIEIKKLEKRLNLLATIAYISPLLGLLGTVLGMIAVFGVIEARGAYVNVIELSQGIRQALITTASGLSIGIPCYVIYNYFVSRVELFTIEMSRAASEMLRFIKIQRTNKGE
jgi:biopolymer transport protein ExbB